MILRVLLLAIAARQARGSSCAGQLAIGGTSGSYVMGAGGNLSGGNLTLRHNSGYSLTKTCEDDDHRNPFGFTVFQLLGHTLSFTVDLSRVGCACNLALYLVKAPARDRQGNTSPGTCSWSPYYCDANGVCGQWCPEMDIMEANNRVFSSTPHRCDAPSSRGHYSGCDREGCSRSTTLVGGSAYGPGSAYQIDTTRPFDVIMSFHGSGSPSNPAEATFTGMETRLLQGNQEVILDFSECGGYFSGMADAMAEGMVMRITYWGGDAATMSWLDQPPCGASSCSGSHAGEAMISNIQITSLCPREITIEGLDGPTFVKGFNGNASGAQLLLRHNSGYSVTESCDDEWDPNHFKIFQLLGQTLSFTVDLSQVGCACNVALYLIRGPPRDWSGNPSTGSCERSPYYCDANRVCGQWCPEIDVMEANNRVFQSTPHRCDEPSDTGHYSNCDRKGCDQSTKDLGSDAYGPGTQYKIDTRHPFTVHTTFHGSAMKPSFTGLTVRLQQGVDEIVLNHGNCAGYLGSIADAMQMGMSMRITYWGDDAKTMKWLDSPPCGEQRCSGSNAGSAVISDILVISSNAKRPVAEPPGYPVGDPGTGGGPAPGPPARPAPPAPSAIPWWVFLFVWVSVLQSCLLCLLGAFTVHLHQQITAPSATGSPRASMLPLTGSPMMHVATESLPQFEKSRSAMLMPHKGAVPSTLAIPVSPVRAHEV